MAEKDSKTNSIETRCTEDEKEAISLSKAVIEHLSKEIQTSTTNIMLHRSKIAFAVYLGPYLLLIAGVAAATKGLNISPHLGKGGIAAIVGGCLCFLVLGYMNARIERQAWEQCNKWRRVIAEIQRNPSKELEGADLADKLYESWRSQLVYVVAYAVLLASFIMSIIIIIKLRGA
ncbi:MAG TPA: hypothetical protein VGQ72_10430 [Pyrinomonadaceae bacterium]|jgi:hypothetical protein|nr:hypothetical protein [Pyrinomonadaceae bacterium]